MNDISYFIIQSYNIIKMSEVEKNIVQNFRSTCLRDLKQKEQQLTQIKLKTMNDFENQSQQKLEEISKILVNLQDELVKSLRQKFKLIIQFEEERIREQVINLQKIMEQIIQSQREHLIKMIKCLENDQAGGSKLLGKIASGKVQQEWKLFSDRLQGLRINSSLIAFQKQDLQQIVEDIIQILHVQIPDQYDQYVQQESSMKKSQVLPNISKNESINIIENNSSSVTKNRSKILQNYSSISGIRQKLNKSKATYIKNESLISVKVQTEKKQEIGQEQVLNDRGTTVVDEYKQTRTIKKLKKIEQKYKQKQKSPEKDVERIAKLVLQRKKLLNQLQ